MVLCTRYLFRRNVDGLTHYCSMLYIIILMRMHRLPNCYYLDTMTSCLKGFPDPERFHFQSGFSFLTMLLWAKDIFGWVAPPIDHLRNRAFPQTGYYPSLSCLSFI